MATLQQHGADLAPGLAAPEAARGAPVKDEAPGVVAEGFREQGEDENPDCAGAGLAEQAAQRIEGEAYARAWLARIEAGMAQPGELAVILSFLVGEMLAGACRLIEKTLEGGRHG